MHARENRFGREKAQTKHPDFLREHTQGSTLAVKVQPRASRSKIGALAGDELNIKVTAPPVDSAANEAVLRLLADMLDCPRGAVQLLRGATGRRKLLLIRGLAPEAVFARLRDL